MPSGLTAEEIISRLETRVELMQDVQAIRALLSDAVLPLSIQGTVWLSSVLDNKMFELKTEVVILSNGLEPEGAS